MILRRQYGKSQLISPEAFLFPYALIINRTKHKINLFVRFFCFIFLFLFNKCFFLFFNMVKQLFY